MYLPTESLWSEVLKVNGLVERVQRDCHVTIVGPTVLAAFLNSLQMGFKTLAIEQKAPKCGVFWVKSRPNSDAFRKAWAAWKNVSIRSNPRYPQCAPART